jgi:SAM-dependent methyltransferase
VIRFIRGRQRLFGVVVTHFVRPTASPGAGWEMALRLSNRKRNQWAVALLEVQPQDHILEIGFGPGLAIRELARRATDGFVLGIDYSAVMVRQAAARNRAAVEQGRVELRLGSTLDLRDFSEMFDKALAVNNFGMWSEPEARLKDLRGALRPGGAPSCSRHLGPGLLLVAPVPNSRRVEHDPVPSQPRAGRPRSRTRTPHPRVGPGVRGARDRITRSGRLRSGRRCLRRLPML